MASRTEQLIQKRLAVGAPHFLSSGVQYEVVMGSVAYGVADESSDLDLYGFAIPPKDWVFPHLRGEIPGFDEPGQQFEQFQQHHIVDPQANGGRGCEYDVCIYSLVKYFRLLMENNPNIIDSLFVPRNCILHATAVGERVREQRHLFLHKGCWPKFKGYAYGQLSRLRNKNPEGKRAALVAKFGYDVKFAYHVVRLINEVEQLLLEGTLELARSKEQLKAIRRGEWSLSQVEDYFSQKEVLLESLYLESDLPATPDRDGIRELLLNCLEQHYGSLHDCVVESQLAETALSEIEAILVKYRRS